MKEKLDDSFTESAALLEHHFNPVYVTKKILEKTPELDNETKTLLEDQRQDFIKRMRTASTEITKETHGITKDHFIDLANIAAGQKWDSPKKVNILFGKLRNLGIRGINDRCKSCINAKTTPKSALFNEIISPLTEAIKRNYSVGKRAAKENDNQLDLMRRQFKQRLARIMQEHEKRDAENEKHETAPILDKKSITHLYQWANIVDWKRPEELEAIYVHGCALLGQPARPPGSRMQNYGTVPQLSSHANIKDSQVALESAFNYPATAAQLHSRQLKGFKKSPVDFANCKNNYINELLYTASNPELAEKQNITRNKFLRLARNTRKQDWTKPQEARQAYGTAARMLGRKPLPGLNNTWSGKTRARPRTTTSTRMRR